MLRWLSNRYFRRWMLPTLGVLLLAAIITFVFFVSQEREWARNLQCASNCKGLICAMLFYEDRHGHLPPAHIDAPDGSRMHSWRALMTEELGEPFPYDFREPWNGPHNSKLSRRDGFACPSDTNARRNKRLTNYFVIEGANTPFPGSRTMSSIEKISKGRSNTILIAEANGLDIEWLEPRDFDYDAMSFFLNAPERPSISSHHPQGSHVSMADGSVRCLNKNISPEVLKQMLTADKNTWREEEPEKKQKEQ